MDELFVFESELNAFRYHHPEYNNFEKVTYDNGQLAGYVASIK